MNKFKQVHSDHRLTDTTKNITFQQTTYAGGNNLNLNRKLHCTFNKKYIDGTWRAMVHGDCYVIITLSQPLEDACYVMITVDCGSTSMTIHDQTKTFQRKPLSNKVLFLTFTLNESVNINDESVCRCQCRCCHQ